MVVKEKRGNKMCAQRDGCRSGERSGEKRGTLCRENGWKLRTGAVAAWALPTLLGLVMALGSGQVAWADNNPPTCTRVAVSLGIEETRDLNGDGVGETPITGSKIEGETIYYQAFLSFSALPGACGYEGGQLMIDPPGPAGPTDVTPA